ncbi:MAG: hypothetical protein KAT17_10395, partial [Candidatus Aminicenantes bacterium]|nr:hypothetical protein [Candidatus Aminicenantes bacterium]
MVNKSLKQSIFIVIFLILIIALHPSGNDIENIEKNFLNKIEWTLKSMSNYERQQHFVHHIIFELEWRELKKRLNLLSSKIGNEITGENINTAEQQFEFINTELKKILKENTDKILIELFSNINPHVLRYNNITSFANAIAIEIGKSFMKHNSPDQEIEKENICPEELAKYGKAVMAMENSGLYRKGSARYLKYSTESIRLFYEIASSGCLAEQNGMKTFARQFIDQKKQEIQTTVLKLKNKSIGMEEREALLYSICAEELAIFQELDYQWVRGLNFDIGQFPRAVDIRELSHLKTTKKPDQATLVPKEEKKPESIKPLKKDEWPETKPVRVQTPGDFSPVALDVWQSAWGDFKNLDVLISYLKRNNIKKINLNPGLPMGPKFYQEAYKKFKPLVDKFHAGGVKNIGFLYAELNYPIEFYAKFLATHRRELKIDTIVDDSEFVDIFRNRFERNIRKVKQYGIKYSAFVTLESRGNSGVSDSTRFWVIDNADYPILMSYFGCTL